MTKRTLLPAALLIGALPVFLVPAAVAASVFLAPAASAASTPAGYPGTTTPGGGTTATASYNLPTIYASLTQEGTDACSYAPKATVTSTLTSPLGTQSGPTFTADSNGCVNMTLLYIGNEQFNFTLPSGNWSKSYTLGYGTDEIVLTGPTSYEGTLVSTVKWKLVKVAGAGDAPPLKGHGVPLDWILAIGVGGPIVLSMIGLLLRFLSLRNMAGAGAAGSGLLAGADNDDDEEGEELVGALTGEPPVPIPPPH